MFNITNANDVMFHSRDPILKELGPYTYAMVERKQGIKHLDGGNQVFYRSNKTWVFDQQWSCKTCLCKDEVAIPNFVFMGLIYLKRTLSMPKPYKFILDIFMIVMKMQPVKRLTVCEVLLDSYKDPVVEFIHTQFFKFLKHALHLKTPDFPDLGFLPKYNKTSDGDFVIMTGKDDIENIGQIISWNNYSELPWWNTHETRIFKGSGDGINQRPGIGKNDKYEMFQPLTCRKYSLGYSSHEGYTYGIPSVGYSIDEDSYDGVKNIGYRYENLEKANYFPGWACGLNHTKEITERCTTVSCDHYENWCDKCCNANFINETYVLPPGIIPLRCQPARTTLIPLGLFLSAPHFLSSPEYVRKSVSGLSPNPILHDPGMFHLNPLTGHTVSASFRIQFNIPLYSNPDSALWSNLPTTIVPAMWLDLEVQVQDYALNFFYLVVVVSQRVVFIISIVCLTLSALPTALIIFHIIKRKKGSFAKNVGINCNGAVPKHVNHL
ncbi:unnamed protein product [Caenorhabditis brenneri]